MAYGTINVDTLTASTGVLATQNGMTGIAKAWVNFNGTTPTINASFNVGSITKNGTGDYTLNFTTAMSNANYAPVLTGGTVNSTNFVGSFFILCTSLTSGATTKTTSALRVVYGSSQNPTSYLDQAELNVTIFGA